MSFSIILNSSNVVGSNNSSFNYKFIGGGFKIPPKSKMCISTATIPYSWFNVNQQSYNNAVFSISYPIVGGAAYTTSVITLVNGFYQVSDMNTYIQKFCISLGLFLVSTTAGGPNLYFYQIATNITYYSNQVLTFLIPSTSTNLSTLYPGYRVPALATEGVAWYYGAGPTYYTTAAPVTGTFNILSTSPAFGTLIGYAVGVYPPTPIASNIANYNTLGSITPNLTPVNSLIMRCSLVFNNVTVPSDILDAIPITNATFGANINYSTSWEKWVDIGSGLFNQISFSLQDQNFNPIPANDSNILISIFIQCGTEKQYLSYSDTSMVS